MKPGLLEVRTLQSAGEAARKRTRTGVKRNILTRKPRNLATFLGIAKKGSLKLAYSFCSKAIQANGS